MGLAQRMFEQAGLTTVALSPIPNLTAAVGAPRVAAIGHPPGRTFGRPGDPGGQSAVLRAALQVAWSADTPGQVVDLPFEWPEPASAVRTAPAEPPPIVRLLQRRPWLWPRLVARDVPR